MHKQENMTPSIDESILRLKGEIISQDWQLTEKQAESLATALQCLKQQFKARRAVYAILTMAENTLDFIRRNGENCPPECMDFFKESMMHVINIQEKSDVVPADDALLFKSVYSQFTLVKTKIHEQRPEILLQTESHEDTHQGFVPQIQEAIAEDPPFFLLHKSDEPDANRLRRRIVHSSRSLIILEDAILSLSPLLEKLVNANEPLSPEMEALFSGLHETLRKTDTLGRMIRDVLLEVRHRHGAEPEEQKRRDSALSGDGANVEEKRPPERTAATACPAMDLIGLVFGEFLLFVPAEHISIVRELTDSQKKNYLQKTEVPLKDFGRLFQSLSRQFQGGLATVKASRLRKLKVPVMVPRGLDLTEEIQEDAEWVVVLTHGPWSGAILCTGVIEQEQTMIRYQRSRNGDIVGIGFTKEGEELPLLDVVGLLKREGFKIII